MASAPELSEYQQGFLQGLVEQSGAAAVLGAVLACADASGVGLPREAQPDDREERLPQWAQRSLGALRMRVRELTAALSEGPDESDTFVDPYTRPRTPLGQMPTIVFVLSDGTEVQARLIGRGSGQHLSVSARDGHLLIAPQSSNVARIRASRRSEEW